MNEVWYVFVAGIGVMFVAALFLTDTDTQISPTVNKYLIGGGVCGAILTLLAAIRILFLGV